MKRLLTILIAFGVFAVASESAKAQCPNSAPTRRASSPGSSASGIGDGAGLQLAVHGEAEGAVRRSEHEAAVVAGGHARLQQPRPRIGVGRSAR